MAIGGSQVYSREAAGKPAALAGAERSAKFLPLYLVAAYLAHGVAQHFCLVAQPLEYYLLRNQGYTAAQVAWFLSILMIPWIVKPVFGVLSDFVPVGALHRKPYLIGSAAFAAVGFCLLSFVMSPALPPLGMILLALTMTSVAMAASTVVLCALVASASHHNPARSRSLFSLQAGAYYVASIGSGLLGGYLCQKLQPAEALRVAALCCAVATAAVCLISVRLSETKTTARQSLRDYKRLIWATLRSRKFRAVAAFTFLWNLSPSFGTPLFFYFTQRLQFDQSFIGALSAINSFGMLCGAGVFRLLTTLLPCPRRQAVAAILAGVVANCGYVFCNNAPTAVLLEFVRGLTTMVAILTIYGYAADVCPKRITATTIGLVIAVYNIGSQLGAILGANIFTYWSHGSIQPLAVISSGFTLACLLAVPFLPKHQR